MTEAWDQSYVTWSEPAGAVADVICVPHGAGGAGHFRAWSRVMPPTIALRAVRLPGRESRLAETPLSTMDGVLDALAPSLERADRPIALFGLCSGAIVAFELAHRLADLGAHRMPVELIVAAQSAPSLMNPALIDRKLGGMDAVALMTAMGEMSSELLASPELMELATPVLDADLAVLRSFVYRSRPALTIPVSVLAGENDQSLRADELSGWSRETSSACVVRRVPGGHLMAESWLEVGQWVGARVEESVTVKAGAGRLSC